MVARPKVTPCTLCQKNPPMRWDTRCRTCLEVPCAHCGASHLPYHLCEECNATKRSLILDGRTDLSTIPQVIYRITYRVKGTEHNGHCSGADPVEVDRREVMEDVPVLESVPESHRVVGAVMKRSAFFNANPAARLYDDLTLHCRSGSGYCGTSMTYTLKKVEVIASA